MTEGKVEENQEDLLIEDGGAGISAEAASI